MTWRRRQCELLAVLKCKEVLPRALLRTPQARPCLPCIEAQVTHCSCHYGGTSDENPLCLGTPPLPHRVRGQDSLCFVLDSSDSCFSGRAEGKLSLQRSLGGGSWAGKVQQSPCRVWWIPTIAQEQGPGDYIRSSHGLEHDSSPWGLRLKSQFLAVSSYLQAHPAEEESVQEDLSYSSLLTAFLPHVGKTGQEAFGPVCWKREACNVGRKRGPLNPST